MSVPSQKKHADTVTVTDTVTDTVADVGTGDVQAAPAKNFSLWSTLGISYSITSTPISIGTYLSVVIGVGGSPVFFFGYILAVCMDLFVCASLAEMAAVMPHSSGQIHWTARLAPPRHARGLSYVVGWLTAAGYFFWTAATFLITAQLLWALVQICHPAFVTHPWHFYVLYLAVDAVSMLSNTPRMVRWYPYLLKGVVWFVNVAALVVLVALLARTHPKASARSVFVDIVNETGWSSNGVVFFLGLLPGLSAVNGFDAAAHLAEEMPNPAHEIPQVMVGSAVASGLGGLPMILVFMFCITNAAHLLDPVGGQPVAQLLVDSLRSEALTVVCMVLFIATFAFASASELTTWSRVWWALARENGTPCPGWLGRVDAASQLPYNAVLFASVACAVLGVLELASSLALNAILGAAIICIFTSYAIPIFCLLLGRRRAMAGKHYFDLGRRAGFVVNGVAVAWIALVFVWLCFPLYIPYSNANMNWAIVVFAGILVLSGVNWLVFSRKHYTHAVEDGRESSIGSGK